MPGARRAASRTLSDLPREREGRDREGGPPVGRLLGVDPGTRRIGLALSDPAAVIASPFATLSFTTEAALLDELRRTSREHGVRLIVIGRPVRTDGTPTPLGEHAERLSAKLTAGGVPACTWDEQFTSRDAAGAVGRRHARGGRGDRGRIDRTAAAFMLQDYLEHGYA